MTLHWVHTAAIAKTDEYYSRDHLFKYVFVLDTLSVTLIPLHHWYQSTVAILSQSRIWHRVTATLPVSRVLISCVCCQFLVPLSGFSIILGDLHHNARIEDLFGLELLCVCVCAWILSFNHFYRFSLPKVCLQPQAQTMKRNWTHWAMGYMVAESEAWFSNPIQIFQMFIYRAVPVNFHPAAFLRTLLILSQHSSRLCL